MRNVFFAQKEKSGVRKFMGKSFRKRDRARELCDRSHDPGPGGGAALRKLLMLVELTLVLVVVATLSASEKAVIIVQHPAPFTVLPLGSWQCNCGHRRPVS